MTHAHCPLQAPSFEPTAWPAPCLAGEGEDTSRASVLEGPVAGALTGLGASRRIALALPGLDDPLG